MSGDGYGDYVPHPRPAPLPFLSERVDTEGLSVGRRGGIVESAKEGVNEAKERQRASRITRGFLESQRENGK